ncbi:MAG TPA: hypothetical protein VHK69_11630, partial [Chitinophagaceae bacterium]|nr:hypothetical protein [Chitinophagaceae bacterium]
VRSQYKLATHELNDTFLDALHAKSGYPREDLKTIVEFIQFSETAPTLSEAQLHRFYKQLETYYQKT